MLDMWNLNFFDAAEVFTPLLGKPKTGNNI